MATATASPSINAQQLNALDNTQKSEIVRGTVTFSAATDTYAAGGLIMDFAPIAELIKSDLPPTYVKIWSQKAVGSPNTTLYLYSFNPGSTQANGKVQIWEQSGVDDAPLDEYDDATAITNPAADTLVFEAIFPRFQ